MHIVFLFFPALLFVNCIFLFMFKKWISIHGIFYISIFVLLVSIFLSVNELYLNLTNNTYYYVDFGRWFYILDILDSHLIFCFDNLAVSLSIVVLVLTSIAQCFGVEYMSREAFINRLIYLLNMFATSVILLFCVYDFFLVLVAWEMIGLFSFLLVNFYSQRIYTTKASLKTFIFSRISDMFIFIAFNLSLMVFNTTDLSVIFLKTPFYMYYNLYFNQFSINFLFVLTLCIAIAGSVKSAQFFFHVWLPDAMEAPTPASALIHSSTLVIMGIYIIVRFSIVFEFCPFVNYLLSILGGFTIAFGAVVASFQYDIKKLVAYSTISQMGYLICGCGFCSYEEVIIYLIMHAVNKAFLFIIVGYTVHFFTGNTDLRQISSVYLYSFDIAVFFLTISINLIGLPYSAGFYSKEFLLFQVLRDDFLNYIIRATWLISFCFTPYYMFLLTKSVVFSSRKGVCSVYHTLHTSNADLFRFKLSSMWQNGLSIVKFSHSLFSSRFTTVLLLVFWIIFYFSGENLMLVLLNYNTSSDSIQSSFFLLKKVNFSFAILNFSSFTFEILFFYIVNFTFIAIVFLIWFKFTNMQKVFKSILWLDFLYIALTLYWNLLI